MANVYNHEGKLWELDTSDILVSPEKGGVLVRKVWCQMNSEADGVQFECWNPRTAAVHDLHMTNITVSGTNTITDADSGGEFSSTAAGQWIQITECTTEANNGWWYLKTDTNDNVQVVEIGANYHTSANTLTNGTSMKMRIRFYSPETCMYLVNDTIGGTSSLHHPDLDFGPQGRYFSSLSMIGFSGALCCVYIE